MPLGLLGLKVGMTQVYNEQGQAIPVTVLQVGPCTVLQIREPQRDGYHAVQLGFLDKSRKKATRAERGHVARIESKRSRARLAAGVHLLPRANCEPKRFIREFRVDGPPQVEVGAQLTVSLFDKVPIVDVTGITKGRGRAGVMKRHGFGGLPASHGVKRHHRAPGSIGAHATDRGQSGKLKKGKRMAGHYGHERCTVLGLQVVRIDPEKHVMLVKGAVPGPNGGLVLVRPHLPRGTRPTVQGAGQVG